MKKTTFHKSLGINSNSKNCVLDGKKHKTLNGFWTFYVPKIQTKWFYSAKQKVVCLREKHPQKLSDINESTDYGVYSPEEWKAALSESIHTKAATNYALTERFYEHGLGPKPSGFALGENIDLDKINSAIRQQIRGYVSGLSSAASVRLITHDSRIENLAHMLKLSKSMLPTPT
jgi:hypothetical protein